MAVTTTLWRLKVLADRVEEFERLVLQLVRDVHDHEPGQVFEYRRARDAERTYVLFLSFDNEAAFVRYSEAPWHRGVSPAIIACLDGAPVAEQLDTF
jgi:quinol monooxygenase YgiN